MFKFKVFKVFFNGEKIEFKIVGCCLGTLSTGIPRTENCWDNLQKTRNS